MKENVCIDHEKKNNMLYAVGSLSHVSLLETRSGKAVGTLCSNEQGAGKQRQPTIVNHIINVHL